MSAAEVKEEVVEKRPGRLAPPREVCEGSGKPAEGMEVLSTEGRYTKVKCSVCGGRVATYEHKKGDQAGKLTLDKHFIPRPRIKVSEGEPVHVVAEIATES